MMSTPVMLVLSALLVTMVTCSPQPADNYTEHGMDGKWYIVGVATHGWASFTRSGVTTVKMMSTSSGLNAMFSVPIVRISSRWAISFSLHRSGPSCKSHSQVFLKDQTTAGRFTYHNQPKNYAVVVKQYDSALGYAVVRTAVDDEADDDFIDELYSRTPTVSDAVKDMFVAHGDDDGIPRDKVKFLDNRGIC